ncbi:hypothetical protein AXG93_909s1100 [Marchantia polymorpha subsp. ruderalis]|uniref:Fatty acyl-CoA reductase n=1 Tax=Marchantia polymorpha subsp. ruderalis TaxID=1480154 RepID=A0A176VEM0_MARPO|nr:hypothetical protein AXG93_909s1100 [Marchantia polymorpha subsp. ruderalis]
MALWASAAFRSLSEVSGPSSRLVPDMTDRKPARDRQQHGMALASLRNPVGPSSTPRNLKLKSLMDHQRSALARRHLTMMETLEGGILCECCRTGPRPGTAAGREERMRQQFRTRSMAAEHQRGEGSEDDEEDPVFRLIIDGDAIHTVDWPIMDQAAVGPDNAKAIVNGDCSAAGSEKNGAHANGAVHTNGATTTTTTNQHDAHANGAMHTNGATTTNQHGVHANEAMHTNGATTTTTTNQHVNGIDTRAAEAERANQELTKDHGNGRGYETNGAHNYDHDHMHSNGATTVDRSEAGATAEPTLNGATTVDASTPPAAFVEQSKKVYIEKPTEAQAPATSAKPKRAQLKPAPSAEELDGQHIQVRKFLKNKNLLYIGVTGFLCKVAAERTLDVQPDVGTIYVLVKPNSTGDAQARLRKDIIGSEIFEALKKKYGEERFLEFMKQKVVAIPGNIVEKDLALAPADAKMLMERIDVIVNSAATTKFDERYDLALELNTFGPYNVLEFAKKCSRRPMLVHISTAYVNGKRRGVSKEEPFEYGQTLLPEIQDFADDPDEPDDSSGVFSEWRKQAVTKLIKPFWPAPADKVKAARKNRMIESLNEFLLENDAETAFVNPEKELELALKCRAAREPVDEKLPVEEKQREEEKQRVEEKQRMELLGHMRANTFGWQDAYVFTKAMGEMMLMKYKEDLPIVIIRPSVVESTLKKPFDGWIEGNRMLDPIVLHYGKGDLTGFRVDPDVTLDIIPADIVANVILAAMAKHGGYEQMYPFVYQVASSASNPLTMRQIADTAYEHFSEFPMQKKEKAEENGKKEEEEIKELVYRPMTFITNERDFQALLFFRYGVPMQLMELMSRFLNLPWIKKLIGGRNENPVVKIVQHWKRNCVSHTRRIGLLLSSVTHMAEVYKPYVFYKGRFDATNSEMILTEIAPEERRGNRGTGKFAITYMVDK